jgi:hypothetical protein
MAGFPSPIQKLTTNVISKAGLTNKYSGRTITIIARKNRR